MYKYCIALRDVLFPEKVDLKTWLEEHDFQLTDYARRSMLTEVYSNNKNIRIETETQRDKYSKNYRSLIRIIGNRRTAEGFLDEFFSFAEIGGQERSWIEVKNA